jgi:hypothetical protein
MHGLTTDKKIANPEATDYTVQPRQEEYCENRNNNAQG